MVAIGMAGYHYINIINSLFMKISDHSWPSRLSPTINENIKTGFITDQGRIPLTHIDKGCLKRRICGSLTRNRNQKQ